MKAHMFPNGVKLCTLHLGCKHNVYTMPENSGCMQISVSMEVEVKSLTSMNVSVGGDSLPERSISGLLIYGTGESFLFFMAKFPWASCKANRLKFHVSEEKSTFAALDKLHETHAAQACRRHNFFWNSPGTMISRAQS